MHSQAASCQRLAASGVRVALNWLQEIRLCSELAIVFRVFEIAYPGRFQASRRSDMPSQLQRE